MKNKFTILGCGSSLGSPWINSKWGRCDKKNKKNIRTRCCAHIQYNNLSILIDTSPDIRNQLIDNKIKDVDAILYTHEHADQTGGIFEFRPYYFANRKKIPVFADKKTKFRLKSGYPWLFKNSYLYPQIMQLRNLKSSLVFKKNKSKLKIKSFNVIHGKIIAKGYLIKKLAYISDCNAIPKKSLNLLKKLDHLILDCFRYEKHITHFNLDDAIETINILKPKKAILTNLHTDFDYNYLKKNLPSWIVPAYDGMKINF